tara:strand:+ start:4374 stop:4556 length:183 start_codon:yes stop_codon:yes gene_type:complete
MTKSWLNNNNIPFIEKNVENEEYRMELIKMGYSATPVVVSNGTAILGYSPPKLKELFIDD